MTDQISVQAASRFFHEEPGFDRLLMLFKKKYQSLGRIGGSVQLSGFTEEEKHTIADFYGIHPQDLIEKPSVTLKRFENQLQKTRFEKVTLHELLEAYFGETLVSNRAKKEQKQEATRAFFLRCVEKDPVTHRWITHILQKSSDTRFIYGLENTDRSRLKKMMHLVAKALDELPDRGDAERLPVFSQRITGDPHAFDVQGEQGKLLLHALAVHQALEEEVSVKMPSGSEEINDLLQDVGLLRDDLHNFVTCAGLLAETNGEIHPVWNQASLTRTVWHVPVRELVKTSRIYPYQGHHVWILENSGVCSAVLDVCPTAAIVCTHGQFKLATWLLLDRMVKNNIALHYSGDFDPEGLLMAQKLKERYPNHICFWRMDEINYRKTGPEKPIEEYRLNKLGRISHPDLFPVAQEMKQLKVIGYQEALIDVLITDIKYHLNF